MKRSNNSTRRRRFAQLLIVASFAALAVYAHYPAHELGADVRADQIIVLKSERKLVLIQGDRPLKEYRIALGDDPVGPKLQEGDGRTPEGRYVIDYRKADSFFHRALHISYPSASDLAQATARGESPGGLIMIHGIRNGLGFVGRLHRLTDWTNGCIAVTNTEIEEIWRAVPDGTPIEIRA